MFEGLYCTFGNGRQGLDSALPGRFPVCMIPGSFKPLSGALANFELLRRRHPRPLRNFLQQSSATDAHAGSIQGANIDAWRMDCV